ncbi:MAG: hypothetical protein ABTQ28_14490 [Thauera sp.]|jgi:hypothetical protein|nr:hypothetical protein [Burkholderiaceae bacterium]
MKRHTRLAQLSREHHTALRLGRHLLAGGARAGVDAELPGIDAHFAEEKRNLLPLLETLFEEIRP